jgi:hypothetical protein
MGRLPVTGGVGGFLNPGASAKQGISVEETQTPHPFVRGQPGLAEKVTSQCAPRNSAESRKLLDIVVGVLGQPFPVGDAIQFALHSLPRYFRRAFTRNLQAPGETWTGGACSVH